MFCIEYINDSIFIYEYLCFCFMCLNGFVCVSLIFCSGCWKLLVVVFIGNKFEYRLDIFEIELYNFSFYFV